MQQSSVCSVVVTMRKYLFFSLLTTLVFPSLFCRADEVGEALSQLKRANELIDYILPTTEQTERARLGFIKKNLNLVKTSIQEKGLAHAATMRNYQQLIIAFRYSVSFFKQIETEFSVKALKELSDINELIVKARGFDDTPYTQITANVFTEMYQLVQQLSSLSNLPQGLQPKLQSLVPKIGNVIAIAKQGDRPKTFNTAIPLSQEITALYADFARVQHANPAFNIVLDIQGLNEFYAEYAQIEGSQNP